MSRLIDGDALMRKLEPIIEAEHQIYGKGSWGFAIKCMNEVGEAPTIEPEQRWIPVSERLPDLDKYSHGKIWKQQVLITGYFSFDDKKELFIQEEFASNVVNDSTGDIVVIAWMPLPKPYREGKE